MPDYIVRGYNQGKLRRARAFDRGIGFLLGLSGGKIKKPFPNEPRNILVVQSHLIGDVIMATPLLRALRKNYPKAEISLLANGFARELLDGSPHVDRIIPMSFPWSTYDYGPKNMLSVARTINFLRGCAFDLAIDAQIDVRNAFLMYLAGAGRRLGYDITGGSAFLTDVPAFPKGTVNVLDARLSLLSHIGLDAKDRDTELPISKSGADWAETYFKKNRLDPVRTVAIHPGASAKEKRWSNGKFALVAEHLGMDGYQPVLVEGPGDRAAADSIETIFGRPIGRVRTSLKNVVAFISKCRLLVCLDSSAVHIAGATGTPAVAVYGPKWPELTRPPSKKVEVVWDETFDCRPCEYGKCKRPGRSCMDAVEADAVIEKADRLLSGQ